MSEELAWLSLRGTVDGLRAGAFSAREVLEATLGRIEQVNPQINAVVTLDVERARAAAREADLRRAGGEALPALHGVPVVVKDLEDTAGMRTTYGSPIFREHVPEHDGMMARRLRAAGANVIGKSNTPEFGAGSQTFNEVFGPTRNPYDLSRTAGGSSGGAAAAVAAGMVTFADGSDLAASIRNPASFCDVVGLRPSPGRWPDQFDGDGWDPLAVLGPIARDVADVAYALDALSGRDDGSPISLDAGRAAPPAARSGRTPRIAWTDDLGDLPVEPAVTEVLHRLRERLEQAGWEVVDDWPDLRPADEAFDVLRALGFLGAYATHVEQHRPLVKDTVIWNVERGRALGPEQIARALRDRTRAYHAMRAFLERFDALALPTCQVAPFPVEVDWPREVAGRPMEHYVQWLRSCSRITVTAHPAISIPAGLTADGLPVGLQLVGRHRQEHALLDLAARAEAVADVPQRPSVPA